MVILCIWAHSVPRNVSDSFSDHNIHPFQNSSSEAKRLNRHPLMLPFAESYTQLLCLCFHYLDTECGILWGIVCTYLHQIIPTYNRVTNYRNSLNLFLCSSILFHTTSTKLQGTLSFSIKVI